MCVSCISANSKSYSFVLTAKCLCVIIKPYRIVRCRHQVLRPCEAEVGTSASVSAPVAGERGWGDVCWVLLSSHNHSLVYRVLHTSRASQFWHFRWLQHLIYYIQIRVSGLCQPSPPWWRWTRCWCSPCWCWAASSPPQPPSAATSPGGSTGADRGQQSRRTPGV